MAVASWSIPAIPLVGPPARGVLLGGAFLTAARPQAWRCRASPRRARLGGVVVARAGAAETPVADSGEAGVLFSEKFPLRRCRTVEGKAWVRVDAEPDGDGKCKVVIGCDVEGKWVLHWGVSFDGEHGREWDQPPTEMRPPGSVPIKDYAIETPLDISHNSEGLMIHEVQIKIDKSTPVAAINFVLKEEETGAWFQHKGRDFRIPLSGSFGGELGKKQDIDVWPGALGHLSNVLQKPEGPNAEPQKTVPDGKGSRDKRISGFYEEYPILKSVDTQNFVTVTVREKNGTNKHTVEFDTDIPGEVVIHWGVCKDNTMTWEIPPEPHPPTTKIFRQKALQTLLQEKGDGTGNSISFLLDAEYSGLIFVLKLDEYTWLRNMENGFDFYIPLTRAETHVPHKSEEQKADDKSSQTDGLISDIRNLVVGLSSRRGQRAKNKVLQEDILQEIERLAAEAYSIFRSPTIDAVEESVYIDDDSSIVKPACSGTGTGFEILCQGFNWESHKSGKWYLELGAKAKELSSLGFTIVWSPPPTDSVSPEGYMPRDLYNLNSRYGTMEELKEVVKNFHEAGMKVLGDAVLNHRCAQFQNQNGVWNIFGGRLNWDERAVVADDPHFQGKGNKSSGDNFHAAPNIDHSQEFVRNDLKQWLCWMRKEVGYDGWRLDFVRGFWGGYVKDYLEASEPYFAVGEYWDSLSYTYGEMDYNQDAHRQRIVDWINATNGTAGAFDVTTKGILHAALERSEYWRLSDEKGKPPGVLGWWPSRAVTFIENHDTGSTQGHWRFPFGMELQGYVYILTHPGTPAVFYDHIFSHLQPEIGRLISIRHRQKIHCRSKIKILKAEGNVYAAEIDERITMKIGAGHFEPSGPVHWIVAAEGQDYKVWEVPL